jgi:hypothetical protein
MTTAEIKSLVRERDRLCCTICGMTADEHLAHFGHTLHVHRLVPGSLYTVEGGITLCKPCHGTMPRRENGTPDLASLTPRVVFYLPEDLLAALDEEAEANDRTRTSEIIRALRSHLRAAGRWPRSSPPPAERGGE